MAAYYPPPPGGQYPSYYQPPPPHQPPLGVAHPPPPPQPQYHQQQHLPQQFLPHQQQPPFPSYAPQPSYPQLYSHDEVRTLFVAGLPEDVKHREIYNLFREFPGYESSHLRSPTSKTQPFAFAVFVDQQSAVAAKHELNGMIFDLEKNSTLYVDLAKSNSRSKRSRRDGDRSHPEKRTKGSSFSRGIPDSGVGSVVHMPGMGNSAYNMIGYPSSTQSHGNFDGSAVSETTAPLDNSSAPYIPTDVNACPTLFVADLGPTCSEEELIQVFSRFPGYLKLKMQNTYGAPVAFVDFQDAACSSEARNRLQGTILYSSPPGKGLRLEYARSRMGMRGRKSR